MKKKHGDAAGVFVNSCKRGKLFLLAMPEDIGTLSVHQDNYRIILKFLDCYQGAIWILKHSGSDAGKNECLHLCSFVNLISTPIQPLWLNKNMRTIFMWITIIIGVCIMVKISSHSSEDVTSL